MAGSCSEESNVHSNLTATPVSDPAIDLSWVDNATNEDEFLIHRANQRQRQLTCAVHRLGGRDQRLGHRVGAEYEVLLPDQGKESDRQLLLSNTTTLSTQP